MQVLLDTKNEYIEHLLDLITIPLAKNIYKIYDKTGSNIKLFQQELVNIKNWNNNKVEDEYTALIKKIKCNYLDKLLKEIIILNIKIKTENQNKIKDVVIIKPYDFIHKCMINIGIFCWKNVYLFSTKNLKPSEKQYHLNLIEKNIRKILKNVVRDIIPFETILDMYKNKKKEKQVKSDDETESENEEEDEEKSDNEEEEEESENEEEEEESEDDNEEESDEEEVIINKLNEETNVLKEEPEELNVLKEEPEELNVFKEEPEEPKVLKEEPAELNVLKEEPNVLEEELKEEPKIPQAPKKSKKVEDKTEIVEDEEENYINTVLFNNKKKTNRVLDLKTDSDSSNSDESESDDNEKPKNENIKKINIKKLQKSRYYN